MKFRFKCIISLWIASFHSPRNSTITNSGATGMRRRDLIVGGAALAGWGLTGARAAPVLSPTNFGMTARLAARRNGWIEVDAAAFEANISLLRGMMGAARLCAVMKADAYGNGIALLIPSIIKLGIRDVAIT